MQHRAQHSEDESECRPSWSGLPLEAGDDLIVIPLHILDTRQIAVPGWEHVAVHETEGGDVEYHTFRRITA